MKGKMMSDSELKEALFVVDELIMVNNSPLMRQLGEIDNHARLSKAYQTIRKTLTEHEHLKAENAALREAVRDMSEVLQWHLEHSHLDYETAAGKSAPVLLKHAATIEEGKDDE